MALGLAVHVSRRENSNKKENAVLTLNMLLVFLWNVSYLCMFQSRDDQVNLRFAFRNIGMLASILAVVLCHYSLMQGLAIQRKTARLILQIEIVSGMLVYPIVIARESITFVQSSIGWGYVVNDYPWRICYDLYCIAVEAAMLLMSLRAIKAKSNRSSRVFGEYGLVFVGIMAVGMVIGTVFPVTGGVVFPWSATAMTMSVACIFLLTVHKNTVRLTVSNISPQIFNRIDTPMMVVDHQNNVTLINQAARIFLQLPEEQIIDHHIQEFFNLDQEEHMLPNQNYDLTCKANGTECRLRFSALTNTFHEPLGTIFMITDMTDKISMIHELEKYRASLQEKLDKKSQELESLTLQAITAVANTIDAKDEYTKGHSVRVAHYASQLARRIGKDEEYINNIEYMALLHDIGKIGVPDAVLNKAGRLNDTEFQLIKQHTVIGAEILKDITMVKGVAMGAKYHHEKYNGTGYPSGLKGEEIPYEARIISIADAFDAMTSNRVYRRKMSMERVLEELEKGSGTQFDPELAQAFVAMLREGQLKVVDKKTENSIVQEANQLLVHIMERQNEQIKIEADYDYMTKLYNRKSCERKINECATLCSSVIMVIDLDRFKQVNDTYGHLTGDIALKEVAACLTQTAPEDAIIGRVGGDEFIVFLRKVESLDEALACAHRLRRSFAERIRSKEELSVCSFSIGVSKLGTDSDTFEDMFRQADKALYHVKQKGGDDAYAFMLESEQAETPQVSRDVKQIIDIFRNTEKYKGAFSVKAQEIRRIYEFARSFAARYHYEMQIVLFTLEMHLSDENLEEREEMIKLFQTSLRSSLRTVDINTRYGSTQVIVILMDTADESVPIVVQRIIHNFYKMYSGLEVAIYYDAMNVRKV